ncbi:MAG TPA: GNAT family N-acetyltransferase [Candidatus Hydrogenedentes bacterium]|nr:GNAT family N-acetyltransferase [Candidatus Hydrogenedentota bacterium]HQH50970.1 GNAT family N-acetyltransferase [Candidatus Hydrogenedentota bacterium]
MSQLKMEHPDLWLIPQIPVPDEYLLRNYREGDEAGLSRVFLSGKLGMETPGLVRESLTKHPCFTPERLFVVEYAGAIVGTASAWVNEYEPAKGYLHMVGVLERHRGKRLGALVTVAAMKYHRDLGFRAQQLNTDDWRESAVRLYLDLGFVPVYVDETHPGRWRTLATKLGRLGALQQAIEKV